MKRFLVIGGLLICGVMSGAERFERLQTALQSAADEPAQFLNKVEQYFSGQERIQTSLGGYEASGDAYKKLPRYWDSWRQGQATQSFTMAQISTLLERAVEVGKWKHAETLLRLLGTPGFGRFLSDVSGMTSCEFLFQLLCPIVQHARIRTVDDVVRCGQLIDIVLRGLQTALDVGSETDNTTPLGKAYGRTELSGDLRSRLINCLTTFNQRHARSLEVLDDARSDDALQAKSGISRAYVLAFGLLGVLAVCVIHELLYAGHDDTVALKPFFAA